MDLRLPDVAPPGWTSAPRIAGHRAEAWATENLYCVACDADALEAHRVNYRVEDYHCPDCEARYQLKAKSGRIGRVVQNSAYDWKIRAIREGRAPNYVFLGYDATASVSELFVLPSHFMVESIVQKRNPLRSTARRAGWVGSNILLGELPPDARVHVVQDSSARRPKDVRADFARWRFLAEQRSDARGWMTDVLACVRRIGKAEFTLDEVYAFEDALAEKHPKNRNVRPKIRQQLQVLRDEGMLAFEGRGRYRLRT